MTDDEKVEKFWEAVMGLAERDHVIPLNQLEGVWRRQVGDWCLYVNGHDEEKVIPETEIPLEPFHAVVYHNGTPVIAGNHARLEVLAGAVYWEEEDPVVAFLEAVNETFREGISD